MGASFTQITSLAKRRGFIFQGSEIYGGLANTWDYGPLGVELKNNIKNFWWKKFVQKRSNIFGLDSAILMNAKVWEASGHVGGFSDPLIDCRSCKNRFRADKLLADYYNKEDMAEISEGLDAHELLAKLSDYQIKCPICGKRDFTEIRTFNLMFQTHQGVTQDSQSLVYLRPETAQGIFVNFKNIYHSSRAKIPFGVAQIGKAFRNEISPSNFIFRTREFEQMEIEYFCHPDNSLSEFKIWQKTCYQWLLDIGIRPELIKLREHEAKELSHYSQATTDIEFAFPFGWGELWGLAHRGDYDLSQHQKVSGKDLRYFDALANKHYLPHVIEPSLGVDRLLLALLFSAYHEDEVDGEKRTVLKLSNRLAPIQVGILSLTKKQILVAQKLADKLSDDYMVDLDVSGSIGKRYRRHDEIGTPYCVTVDFETEQDQQVTVRHRDTMEQKRVGLDQLGVYLEECFKE
ncbi:MAG: glycine--tRNA ligase [SAR324 cluster bacterium]|nr:glycine--tRNA ligase [SAR324 cluster bacterium]